MAPSNDPPAPSASAASTDPTGEASTAGRTRGLRRPAWGTLLLAAVVYVPLLLTRPGEVGADTKTYLYLDPGRLLSRAAHMWDPNIGMGTVTHQNIGYLWPLGPYYWLMDAVGVPDWLAQRLWLGSILFLAGLGVRWMLKELRWNGAGLTVAAFAYAFSPYVLEYAARISVILLPWAALPWLIGLSARALRRNDWATPAVFALVTLTVGGVNATSLILVMFGPLLWFLHATFVEHEVTLRQALVVGLKIVALTAVTSFWWVAGLMLQGAFGIPILRYTETYETVAAAALAPEVLRGLGYWLFYGTDGLGAWTASTVRYLESIPAIALSYALPVLAFAGALVTRWRHRLFFGAIVVVGLVLSVGAHPWDASSPYGSLFKSWTGSDLGLSFRSTPRAAPLVILGLAVFLGSGVAAVGRWRPRLGLPVAAALIVLICANQAPLFLGQMVDRNLVRDEQIPGYWDEAAAALSAGDPDTRVYELPGIDFASYRWGNTVDPITPGLTDREYVARELIPYGSPPSAALLSAVESPFQSGRAEPDALAPLARMMGIGQIVLRADTQYERYRTPRPRTSYWQLQAATGLDELASFGDPLPNRPDDVLRLDDEVELGTPATAADPAPVVLFDVEDPRPVLRTQSAAAPVIMAGDASGIVTLAGVGGLAADRPLFLSATFADDPDTLRSIADEPDAALVVTDSNRRRATRWSSVRDNDGYTERTGEDPLEEDLTDNRLDVFPDAGDDERAITEQRGGATVAASAYGNSVSYSPADRAMRALDGDLETAWTVGAFDDPTGEYLQIDLDEPVTTDVLTLVQPLGGRNRWITEVSLSFDGGEPVQVALDEVSRTEDGQRIDVGERTFDRLRITIEGIDPADAPKLRALAGVGFAEVSIPGVDPVDEVVRPPVDLLDATGASSLDRALTYLFERRGGSNVEPTGVPEEPTLRRWVEGPVERAFTPYGRARLARDLDDVEIDEVIGLLSAAGGGVTASSSARLPGDLRSRASASVDGDPLTAYQTPINDVVGNWIELTYPEPVTVDGLRMELVDDSLHSLPTAITVAVDGGAGTQVRLDVGEPSTTLERGATTTVDAATGELTGTTFRISIDEIAEATSLDWFSGGPTVLPVGIAEIGLPVVEAPVAEAPLPAECRTDLVSIDGTPVALRVVGTVGEALSDAGMDLRSCGDAVELPADKVLLESTSGRATGVDVDVFALSSAAGGAPGVDTLAEGVDEGPPPPETTTERTGRNDHQVTVTGASEPYWVVLGQSYSPGFTATLADGTSLGEPTLINGFANGWQIDPAEHGADVVVSISWPPQRIVWWGLALSAVGVLVCLALVLWPLLRRRSQVDADVAVEAGDASALAADSTLDTPASPGTTPLSARPGPSATTPTSPTPAPSVTTPSLAMVPTLVTPWSADGPTPPVRVTAVVAVLGGLAAWFVAGPIVGLLLAVVLAVAVAVPRGQLVLRLLSVAALAAAGGFIVLKQFRNDYVTDFSWVARFETTHSWGLVAALALLGSIVVDGLRARRAAAGSPTDTGSPVATSPPDGDLSPPPR